MMTSAPMGMRIDPNTGAIHWTLREFEIFPGWREDLSGVRRFEDLPKEARTYVRFLEAQMDVPLDMISVGAERARIIHLRGAPITA